MSGHSNWTGGWWQASDGTWYPPEQHPSVAPPPPPSPSPYGYFSVPAYLEARTNTLAIASLICSIAGFLILGIPAVVGIVLGFISRSQIRRSFAAQRGAGLALAGIIVGFFEAFLIAAIVVPFAIAGITSGLGDSLAIAGSPGYTTFTGPEGKPMAEGLPWGRSCEPIVFQIHRSVPSSFAAQVQTVVHEARAIGIDVTVENKQDVWYPDTLYPPGLTNADVQVVPIIATSSPAPQLATGQPEHIRFSWNAQPSADGAHEAITSLYGTLYIRSLANDPFEVRRSTRQLIAFTQGVGASTASGSGISVDSHVDAFSAADIAAMQRMSGCHFEPTT